MARVYLSSTYEDLKAHRQAVGPVVLRSGFDLSAMEYYPAASRRPAAFCVEDVARCDVYLGLFAFRYGHVPPGEELSIVEQEYLAACRHDLDLLVFLADPKHPWPASAVEEGPGRERLEALKDRLRRDLVVAFFTTPEDLATKVASALANHLHGARQKAAGPLGLSVGQCAACKHVHADGPTRRACDRCGAALHEPCPACAAPNGVWCAHCGRCGVAIRAELERVVAEFKTRFDAVNAHVRAGDLDRARDALAAIRLPGHSRLAKHRDRLERERVRLDRAVREQAQDREVRDFDRRARDGDWLAARESLRELEAAGPDAARRERVAEGLRARVLAAPDDVAARRAYLEVRSPAQEDADERAGEALQRELLWHRTLPLLCLAWLVVPLLLLPKARGRVFDLAAPRRFRQFGPLPAAALTWPDREIRRRHLGDAGTGRFHDGFGSMRS